LSNHLENNNNNNNNFIYLFFSPTQFTSVSADYFSLLLNIFSFPSVIRIYEDSKSPSNTVGWTTHRLKLLLEIP
jgi:hypothetical protein